MPKGRSKQLIELRDEAILRRYHYWTEIKRLRFDDTLTLLSKKEFFISEERIMTIIRAKFHKLEELKVKPVPMVKKPRVSVKELSMLKELKSRDSKDTPD